MALVEGYKTMYLCHLDSYTLIVCNGYLHVVSFHVVTVQLPTRCLVDRFLHRPMVVWIPHNACVIIRASNVVTVQLSQYCGVIKFKLHTGPRC